MSRLDRILNPWLSLVMFLGGCGLYAIQHQYEASYHFYIYFIGGTLLILASIGIFIRTAIREAKNPARIPDEWVHCAVCDYPVDPDHGMTTCPECGACLRDDSGVRYGRKDAHVSNVVIWWGLSLFCFYSWLKLLSYLFD